MGLEAFIPCTCIADGKVSDFPFDPALIGFNHGLAEPRRPAGSAIPQDTWEEISWVIHQWLETCCSHPNQIYQRVRIGTRFSVTLFEEYLQHTTPRDFPTLLSIMPQSGCEYISPHAARLALTELKTFNAIETDILGWALINELDGSEFCHSSHGRIVAHKNRIEIGYGPAGITVQKLGRTILRANRVQQRMSYGVATLVGDDGSRFSGIGIGTEPANWVVRQRPYTGADFLCVPPLTQILTTSVATNMPVHLCA